MTGARSSLQRAIRPSASDDYRHNFRLAAGFVIGGLLLIGFGIVVLIVLRVAWLGGVALGLGVLGTAAYCALRGMALGARQRLSSPRALMSLVTAAAGAVIGVLTLIAVAFHGLGGSLVAEAQTLLGLLPILGIFYALLIAAAVLLDSDRVLDG